MVCCIRECSVDVRPVMLAHEPIGHFARERLPATHRHIHIARIEFDQSCTASCALARDECRASPAEAIENEITRSAAVPNGRPYQLNRLHGRCNSFGVGLSTNHTSP